MMNKCTVNLIRSNYRSYVRSFGEIEPGSAHGGGAGVHAPYYHYHSKLQLGEMADCQCVCLCYSLVQIIGE